MSEYGLSGASLLSGEPTHEAPVPEEEYTPSELDLSYNGSFNVRSIFHPQSNHSVEKKIQAVAAYIVTGSTLKASKVCGVPASTMRTWRNSSCWWPEAEQAAKLQLDKKIESGMYAALEKGIEMLNKQMAEGKDVIMEVHEYVEEDPSTGKSRKVKKNVYGKIQVPFKEAAVGFAVLWDKLQLAQGKPTSRTEKVESPAEIIKQLKAELVETSKAINEAKNLKVVPNQPDKE
jgi:hypothetical protein